MGNNGSSGGGAAEWKGPFSDQVRVQTCVYDRSVL